MALSATLLKLICETVGAAMGALILAIQRNLEGRGQNENGRGESVSS